MALGSLLENAIPAVVVGIVYFVFLLAYSLFLALLVSPSIGSALQMVGKFPMSAIFWEEWGLLYVLSCPLILYLMRRAKRKGFERRSAEADMMLRHLDEE